MLLQGKTIIVTGASSGIGAAAARTFAAEGANIVVGARRLKHLENIADEINDLGRNVALLAGDVSDPQYNADLVSLATSRFGGLNGAFNNAGTTGEPGPISEMTEDNWRNVMAVNLNSAFFAAKCQIPALQQNGGGSLVFTSSFVGHTIGLPGMAAYAASKAGLIGMVQVLAVEHGTENIRINALLPGGTKTEMAGDDPNFHEWVSNLHALKRMADPVEIAQAALFLMSDHASFVTGSAMLVDGGNSITKP